MVNYSPCLAMNAAICYDWNICFSIEREAGSRFHVGLLDAGEMTVQQEDEYLFGWNPTPGIVSVWAQRDGRAVIWRRDGKRILCFRDSYRPWLLATTLDDLGHLGAMLQPFAPDTSSASITYKELDGPANSYRYILLSRNMRVLESAVLTGA